MIQSLCTGFDFTTSLVVGGAEHQYKAYQLKKQMLLEETHPTLL